MVRKALALLVGIAVLGVALGIVGLLRPGIADAQTPSATRTIMPTTVAPGGEVVVTITTSGFTDGGVEEMLPDGFEYKPETVSPNDINVRMLNSGAVAFAMRRVTEFSYTATVDLTAPAGGYGDAFSGVLVYVDSDDARQRTPMDDTPVTVGTATTPDDPVIPDDTEEMPEMPEPTGPSATRSIEPMMVAPGRDVVVTITTMGFTDGGVEERMPAGFRYKRDSVSPSEVGVREVNAGAVVRFAMRNVTEFSYTVTVDETEPRDGYGDSFSGFLRYLDADDEPQTVEIEDTPVMVGDGTSPMPMPGGPSATRTIMPATVAPGGEVVVTITTSGFTDGGVEEMLPDGFEYKEESVSPSDTNVRMLNNGAIGFAMRGVTEFSYTAMVDETAPAGGYGESFSGVLVYVDSDDERQRTPMDDTPVTISGPSATRSIEPMMVDRGGKVVVTITTSGFTDGGVEETLPHDFEYEPESVSPSDINVRMLNNGAIGFAMRGVTEFSYTVIASMTVGDQYFFRGELVYVDENDDRQTVDIEDTQVTVRVPTVIAPPEPEAPRRRRGGGGGGGSGAYPPPIATATPMPTRAPVATIAPTPTPIIVPTIVAPTVAPTPEPTAKPEPTAVPPTAVPTPRPTAIVVVPTVAPTKPPEPTATPKPTAVPTAVPPTEVPPTAVPPTEPPAPTATVAPTVAPVTPVTPDEAGMPTWLIILIIVVIVAVVIAAVGFYMMRMRR